VVESEIFKSSVRSKGDLAGVFKFDGETGYFYLYDQTREATQRIVDQIRVLNRRPKLAKNEVVVRWDGVERMVGLTIQGESLGGV
jgi:hypothetical protein